ncbi:hypothetical protein GN958_ATG09083 [Phytophthora infestans]|uniref:Uncharacterized protein n=1 Tax=Phytophthora infestans TaxID=4787 RepID=A0A8S9UMI7_PHYIN|nr:hypothetical protein GN958_ATG09083 [Phytophthora infestans]
MQWNEDVSGQKPAKETKACGRPPNGKPAPTRPDSTTPATASSSPVAGRTTTTEVKRPACRASSVGHPTTVFVIASPRNLVTRTD